MVKSKKIIVRINPEMKKFIMDFSKHKGMTVSEMCRNIINYWFMAYFTGDLNMEYDKLKDKFIYVMNSLPEENEKKSNNC